MTVTDESLMLAYCQGDESAFAELYTRHKERVYFYIRRFIPREDLVEEVYQIQRKKIKIKRFLE